MFRWIFAGSIGLILALGLSSCVYFLMLWGGISNTAAIAVIEIAVVLCAFLGSVKDTKVAGGGKNATGPWIWVPAAVLAAGLLFTVLWVSKSVDAIPNGNWDAW